jgi:signal transduction histidine kinase
MGTGEAKDRRSRFSVFLKLFLVQLGMSLLVYLVVVMTLSVLLGSRLRDPIEKNIRNYAHLLVAKLGNPPELNKAEQLADEYNVEIRFESQGGSWSTSDMLPKIEEIEDHLIGHGIIQASFWQQFYVVRLPDGGAFLFRWNFGVLAAAHREYLFLLFFLLAVIFVTTHVVMRRILRPVKWLKHGVQQIGEGDLEVDIPVYKHDELGDLTIAVNDMTQRIRQMIDSRNQLLLDVSHELRSPITRMKLALEFIQEGDKKESIQNDLDTMETMISEILETERLKDSHGKLALKKSDIVGILKETARAYEAQSPGIQWKTLPESLFLDIDAKRIVTVLENILDNAVKCSLPESEPIVISLEIAEDKASITIKDDGSGISEHDLPLLFEPFYRVDRSRSKETGGYGLGLSLCKKIMEAHSGQIRISNNENRGVKVSLEFPLS